MGKTIAKIKVPKVPVTTGYNAYQTGHGVHEDKKRKRAYQKRELRKILKEILS